MAEPRPSVVEILRGQKLALAVVVAVALLSVTNWILSPQEALRWLRHMLMLPMLWLGLTLWYLWSRKSARPADADGESAIQRYFGEALMLTAFGIGIRKIALLGLLIWVEVGDHSADLELERRILGLATAAVFMVYGNRLPKVLTPLAMLPLPLAERVSRARRYVGAIWFTLGLGMACAFLALPLPLARSIEFGSVVAGVVTIVGAIVWMNLGPARGER